MSAPAKSKTPSKKKKGNGNSLMLPGLDKLPTKKGGKPVVVVVVKGGKKPPNLSNLPFLMGGKKKKKSANRKKSSTKSTDKKRNNNKTVEDDSDLSESDRVSAPDLPKAHKQKPAASVRSEKSVTADLTSSTSTTSIANAPSSRTPQLNARTPKKATLPKIPTQPIVIQGGIVDRPCVPMFMLINGPTGCPIVVPLDARDESGLVPEGSPQPLRTAPAEPTKGYMVVEEGLLHFKPLKECPQPPPSSTPGTLIKFLSNSNIFIADSGPKLPEEKELNIAPSASIQEKIGLNFAVSGYITIQTEKGTCHFTRVSAVSKQPFYPENAAMGVLVKDKSTSFTFWVPTENRFVCPLLSHNIKIPLKPAKEMAITGFVYKDSSGIINFDAKPQKLENTIGFIMSSATGVPMFASKPPEGPSTLRPKSAPPSASLPPSLPAPVAEPIQPPPPVSPSPPPQRDEISPPPVSSPSPSPAPVAAAAPSPPAAPAESPSSSPTPTAPSLGWSMLSALGSVLTTTATVISNTAGAVTEAATGAGASLPPPTQSPSASPSPVVPSSPSPSVTSPHPAVPPPLPAAKVAAAPKTTKPLPPPLPATSSAEEEAALSAEEAAAAAAAAAPIAARVADAGSNGGRVADSGSTGGKTGVTINITVRDSNSNGGKIQDQKSDGELFSDALSDGGVRIGDQMAGIYRDLLSSQNELPLDEEKEEESKNEEKVERKARPSLSEETRRKAETSKEYKKYKDDRSVYLNPYGYR